MIVSQSSALPAKIRLGAEKNSALVKKKAHVEIFQREPFQIWLSGNTSVSYKTINNFRSSDHAKKIIEKAFVLFTLLLSKNSMLDDEEALLIDGTKLEADANRYSFTWKNASNKFEKSLDEKVAKIYDELIQHQVDIAISKDMLGFSDAIKELIKETDLKLDTLEKDIATEPKGIKGGSKISRLVGSKKASNANFKLIFSQEKKDTYVVADAGLELCLSHFRLRSI